MNRLLLFLIVALTALNAGAQLDYTHWLPPMHSRDNGQISDHYLYLSTPELTPFTVTITDGSGTVLASPVISAGVPFVYEIASDDPSVIMIRDNDLNEVLTNHGIIASADSKFYCNFRARSGVQATSITCKGNAARGTTFRVGSMPQEDENNLRNFLLSFMATEDNTTVTVSDYDTGVEFFDPAGNITLDNLSIMLDSGECYVASGYTNITANQKGIVGALIEADKPIVLNNGNWCGSIGTAGGQDIGMDQAVPIEVLGTEYILIRGDGDDEMERPLVIAHSDGTQIFVNDLPGAIATINAGDYFLIPEVYYTGVGHENMFVRTSVPAYMYQPLGGTTNQATPGLNFIPPISCSLTKEIDMIPGIDKIGDVVYNGAIVCFTIAGATVSVNGIPQVGGEPIVGAPEWESYKITGFTGDVKITSTDRMAAGMFGFNGLAGFAGYYSGFDQIGFVDFSYATGCESSPVLFTDQTVTFSEEVVGWDWSFGDGTTSTEVNPSHLYADGGSYDVFLEITTNIGCTDTLTQAVNVAFAPDVFFSGPNVCLNDTAYFTDETTTMPGITITSRIWDFGDTIIDSIVNPSYLYSASGTYPVSLIVTGDNSCLDTLTSSITIHHDPLPTFTPIGGCLYDSLDFSSTSVIPSGIASSLAWDFGDGSPISTEDNPSHIYESLGEYDINLNVTTDNGCSADSTITITIHPAPSAAFTATDICIFEPLYFANSSTVASPYTLGTHEWNFGDGYSSDLMNPTHNFNSDGTYDIKLITTTPQGCVDSIIQSIHVFAEPVANFTTDTNCYNLPSEFTNLSTSTDGSITSYIWDFGDATSPLALETPSHLFAAPGDYTVALSATSSNGCVGDSSFTITRYPLPLPAFTSTDVCLSETPAFVNNSSIDGSYAIASHSWSFGDGQISDSITPTHDYLSAGAYAVTLVTTSSEGCIDSITQEVQIFAEPVPYFTAVNDCYDVPTSFANLSTVSDGTITDYSWEFGDGNEAIVETPTHNYDLGGIFQVTLAVISENGCSADTVIEIERYMVPVADFSTSNACLYDSLVFTNLSSIETPSSILAYNWDFGDTSDFVTTENPDHLFPSPATYNITLTAVSENGCSNEKMLPATVYPIPVADFNVAAVCLNNTSQFFNASSISSGSISNLDWTFSDFFTSTEENPEKNFSSPGEFDTELRVTSMYGCQDKISKPAFVNDLPVAQIVTPDNIICGNECVTITSLSYSPSATVIAYEWLSNSGHEGNDVSTTFCFANFDFTDSYVDVQLIVTDDNGCKDTLFENEYLTILPTPEANFTINPETITLLDTEADFNNLSSFASEYLWDFGDGTNTTEVSPTHLYEVTPSSSVVTLYAYSDPAYNCVDTMQQIITIEDQLIYYVPNAFTPNGNEVNNIFQPVFTSGYDPLRYHLSIYSRWGEILFESFDANQGWNGDYGMGREQNGIVQDGVYIWTIEFVETKTGKTVQDSGHITLLR